MKTEFNFWPLGIVVILAGFLCGILTLAFVASAHRTDLVSENYYEQEIQYQQRIDGLARAREAGATVAYDDAKRRIVVSLGRNAVTPDAPARVRLYRPSAAGLDQDLPLLPSSDGAQAVDAHELQPGLWKVRASWSVAGLEYLLEGSLTNQAAVPPGPANR